MHIILDFDYTIFDTNVMRSRLADSFGVSIKVFRAAERALKERGALFSLSSLADELGVDVGLNDDVLRDLNDCVYEDARALLDRYAEDTLTLLTFGNVAWQEAKVEAAHLPHIDSTIATDGNKAELARQWADEDDIVVVNDRGSEIDAMAKVLPQARFVWVRREGTPYVDEPCMTEGVIEVTNLNNLEL